jgi:hypothetical protein
VPQYLPSWNDGAAKNAILAFTGKATTPGPGFVEPADWIATFDNDGTLWVEKPAPQQFDFLFRAWTEAVKKDPPLLRNSPTRPSWSKTRSSSLAW